MSGPPPRSTCGIITGPAGNTAGTYPRRVRLRAGVLVLLAVLVAACADVPAADGTVTLATPQGDRTTLVHHPASAGPGAPLVLVLHGATGTAEGMRSLTGWDELAEREGVVVAYPEGLDWTWNAGTCCGSSAARGVDDVGYLHELAAALTERERTDPRRVYAVGFSNGAMLSYAWACARPGDLAGIGPVAGALTVPCAEPAPVRVAAVAGTADPRVPIGGRPGRASLDATLAPFLAAASCADPATAVTGSATVTRWSCAGGRTVARDVLAGRDHTWATPTSGPGTSTDPADATGWVWAQLSAP